MAAGVTSVLRTPAFPALQAALPSPIGCRWPRVWGTLAVGLGCWAGAGQAADLDAKRMLDAHNRARAAVGVPPLRWSARLADNAARWASHLAGEGGCRMQHGGPGENLFWASPRTWMSGRRERQPIDEEDVVRSWANERLAYDRAANACRPGETCGHYTQLVWGDTTEIGCAKSFCPSLAQIWVCHYRPFGNLSGGRPY